MGPVPYSHTINNDKQLNEKPKHKKKKMIQWNKSNETERENNGDKVDTATRCEVPGQLATTEHRPAIDTDRGNNPPLGDVTFPHMPCFSLYDVIQITRSCGRQATALDYWFSTD